MIRAALLALMLFCASSAGVAASRSNDSVTRISAAPPRDGWFVCDGVDGPYAAFAGVVAPSSTSIITLLDRRTGRFDTQTYQVGPGDPGAGQVYWSLSVGGKEVGAVHGVNPGMIDDDGATVPPITSLRLAGIDLQCRFLSHTRFIGVDSRRSVVVTEGPDGLTYQSFDFRRRGPIIHPDGVQRSNRPTLRLLGGSEVIGRHGGFRFANKGYVYFVERPVGDQPATIVVTRGGARVQSEQLVGFTYAPPVAGASEPAAAALGPGAVWSGVGLDICRAKTAAADVDSCLVDAMRIGGASDEAIAFARRLIARDDPGFLSGWKQAGPVGIATITYPFRANTNQGTMLVPSAGDPIDVDAYRSTPADKARADYRAAEAQHPGTFPIPPGDVSVGKAPDGRLRITVTTPTAVCHACAQAGSIAVGYVFDDAGVLVSSGVVAIA